MMIKNFRWLSTQQGGYTGSIDVLARQIGDSKEEARLINLPLFSVLFKENNGPFKSIVGYFSVWTIKFISANSFLSF